MQPGMAKKIFAAFAVVFGILLAIIAMQPAAFTVERHTMVNAPPSVVYAQIDDFRRWADWSPWEKLDGDNLKKTFSGPNSGVGAHYEWAGEKTGEGNMTIKDAKPGERVAIALNFVKPFKAENTSTFVMTPSGAGTDVSWAMTGTKGFMEKAMGLVMDMDKMVGPDFEKGLAEIKRLSEAIEASREIAPPVVRDAPEGEPTATVDAGTP